MTSSGQGNWGLLGRGEKQSTRLKPTLLKSAFEKQQKLEGHHLRPGPAAFLPTSPYVVVPTYSLGLGWQWLKHLALCLGRYTIYTESLFFLGFKTLLKKLWPWLVWLSGLNASLQTERSPVQFPVRARAWITDQVLSWGCARGNWSIFLLHIDVSLPLFLPSSSSI